MDFNNVRFINTSQPSRQCYPWPCKHEGPCGRAETCYCSANRTVCFADCSCGDGCEMKYEGCRCPGLCSTDCICKKRHFDCIEGRCGCSECLNEARFKQSFPVYLGKSNIQGTGLFSHNFCPKGTCIGEYSGILVEDAEYNARKMTPDRLTCFQLTKGTLNADMGY